MNKNFCLRENSLVDIVAWARNEKLAGQLGMSAERAIRSLVYEPLLTPSLTVDFLPHRSMPYDHEEMKDNAFRIRVQDVRRFFLWTHGGMPSYVRCFREDPIEKLVRIERFQFHVDDGVITVWPGTHADAATNLLIALNVEEHETFVNIDVYRIALLDVADYRLQRISE